MTTLQILLAVVVYVVYWLTIYAISYAGTMLVFKGIELGIEKVKEWKEKRNESKVVME